MRPNPVKGAAILGCVICLSSSAGLQANGSLQSSGRTDKGVQKGREGSRANRHPLLGYAFTNELGQPVRLSDFEGQALAITFFFTRCANPAFCPRLSRNFEEASARLNAMPNAPTNWHFISVTIDPGFDTPAVLKAYGTSYHYDPAHWSFLTGPAAKIAELARLSDVQSEGEAGVLNHNFRTLVISAAGDLQCMFPIGGNLSDAIVSEILKAASVGHVVPNAASAPPPGQDANSPSYQLPNGRTDQVRGPRGKSEGRRSKLEALREKAGHGEDIPAFPHPEDDGRSSGPVGIAEGGASASGIEPAGNAQARAALPGH